jgi:hypothetical protein
LSDCLFLSQTLLLLFEYLGYRSGSLLNLF